MKVKYPTIFSKMASTGNNANLLKDFRFQCPPRKPSADAVPGKTNHGLDQRKKFMLWLILFLPVFITGPVSGQRMLTVEEAIGNALQKNYDIILSKNDSAIAAIDYSYRNAAFLPRINGNIGTLGNNNFSQKQTLADGSSKERTGLKSSNITSQLALNWTLFDGLKMFITRNRLGQLVELGELESRNQVVNTVASVINNYYSIVRQKQQLRAIEEQMSIDSERVRLAQYRLDIGVGIKPDLLQSKIDLNAQKAAQLQQQALIEQLKEQLNQAMGLPQFSMYDVTDSISIVSNISLAEVMNLAEKNPSMLVAGKNIDIAKLLLKERRAELLPTVSFNSAYNFNRTTNQAVINNFSTLFNRVHGYNYGFTATIPILNNFNTRRLIKQASWTIDYQMIVYENQRSVTILNAINAFQNYEQQKKALALEEENILLARENLDIVFQTYKLGAATLLQLKEAQNSLADAETRLIEARYNAKVSETELMRLSGQLVK